MTAKFKPDDLYFELQVPSDFQSIENEIIDRLRGFMFAGRVKDARGRTTVTYNKRVELNPDFKALWDKISQKTRYAIHFDTQQLVNLASHKLKNMPVVKPVTLTVGHTQTKLTNAGFGSDRQISTPKERYVSSHETLPDLVGILQERTDLTRDTLLTIIRNCNRLGEFKTNPQGFITESAKQIKKALDELLVDGIRYEKLGGEHYKMELFDEPELETYLDRSYQVLHGNQGSPVQTPYDYIECDSQIERKTAHALDGAENVKFFCKLPRWFTIPTPVGEYNPDWAVVLEEDRKVYLIRETKTTHDSNKRRVEENLKILCGEAHFKALGDVDYRVATSVAEVVSSS